MRDACREISKTNYACLTPISASRLTVCCCLVDIELLSRSCHSLFGTARLLTTILTFNSFNHYWCLCTCSYLLRSLQSFSGNILTCTPQTILLISVKSVLGAVFLIKKIVGVKIIVNSTLSDILKTFVSINILFTTCVENNNKQR